MSKHLVTVARKNFQWRHNEQLSLCQKTKKQKKQVHFTCIKSTTEFFLLHQIVRQRMSCFILSVQFASHSSRHVLLLVSWSWSCLLVLLYSPVINKAQCVIKNQWRSVGELKPTIFWDYFLCGCENGIHEICSKTKKNMLFLFVCCPIYACKMF